MAEDRPLCKCHGEPMLKNGVERRYVNGPKQTWRCGRQARDKARRVHDQLEHVAWSKRLLQMSRAHQRWVNRRKRKVLDGQV